MPIKKFTFHIDSKASIKAKDEEKAKEKIKGVIKSWKGVDEDNRNVGDEIIIGSEVGRVIQMEEQ